MASKDIDRAADDPRGFLDRRRPVLYLMVIAAAMIAAFAFHMRRDGIFACPARAYGDNHYLGYCQGSTYGDFDHGALWFGLEPATRAAAASADVLFVGNSRMQFGFSTPAVRQWFDASGLRYYLLGFSNNETAMFTGPLLRDLQPRARAYVISIDRFFIERISPPAGDVMDASTGARVRYEAKQNWQAPHRLLCSWLPALCGDEISYYRQRETGDWRLDGSRGVVASGIDADLPIDAEIVATGKVIGERFIADLGVDRGCVFLTYVPTKANGRATAEALAAELGFDLISPRLADLRTFDESHLDPASAERFSATFLEASGPRLLDCLGAPPSGEGAAP